MLNVRFTCPRCGWLLFRLQGETDFLRTWLAYHAKGFSSLCPTCGSYSTPAATPMAGSAGHVLPANVGISRSDASCTDNSA